MFSFGATHQVESWWLCLVRRLPALGGAGRDTNRTGFALMSSQVGLAPFSEEIEVRFETRVVIVGSVDRRQ